MSNSQEQFEASFLSPLRKISVGIFVFFWTAGIALLLWRVIPHVYGRETVPLHYNIYVGIDAFGPWWRLFEIPFFALLIVGVHGLLGATLLQKRPMFMIALWSATLFVGVLAGIALVRLVMINLAYG